MQQHTTVSIDGAKTTLAFGAWYDFGLRNGTTIHRVRLDGRARNGDLVLVGTEDGPSANLRPSKIVLVSGAGNIEHALDGDQDVEPYPDLDDVPAPSRDQMIRDLESGAAAPEDFDPRGSGPDRYPDAAEYVRDGESGEIRQARAVFESTPETEAALDAALGPVVVIDPVFETGRATWTSGPIETLRSGDPLARASKRQDVRLRRGETWSQMIERAERELSSAGYMRWIESDSGQDALRLAAEESKAARSGRYASGREAVAKVLAVRKVAKPVEDVVETARTSGSAGRIDGAAAKPTKRASRVAPDETPVPDGSKRCRGVEKIGRAPHIVPVDGFTKSSRDADGLAATCRECHAAKRTASKEGAK